MIETQNWEFKCRAAERNDKTNIWDILVELAPDIPARVEKLEDQEGLQVLIRQCVEGGDSWVAVDPKGNVIGFILARPTSLEEQSPLSLPYVGVRKKWQGHKIFTSLLGNLTCLGRPLTAQVLHANKSNMAENFEKAGFKKEDADDKKSHFRWEPLDATQTNTKA